MEGYRRSHNTPKFREQRERENTRRGRYMRRLVQRKMWWGVNRRSRRNLHHDRENVTVCESRRDIEEILKGRLETIEEEPEAEARERERERRRGREKRRIVRKALVKKAEKGKAIVKAKVKSGRVFYMLCVIGLASRVRGFGDLVLH